MFYLLNILNSFNWWRGVGG